MIPKLRQLSPLLLALVVGCSSGTTTDGKVTVRGTLFENGKPLTIDASKVPLPKGAHGLPPGTGSGAIVQVVFISTETQEQIPAQTRPDTMTFEAKVKPGRYKIAITLKFGLAPDTPDYLKGAYSPEKTQILRDIKGGEDLTLDITKPQG